MIVAEGPTAEKPPDAAGQLAALWAYLDNSYPAIAQQARVALNVER